MRPILIIALLLSSINAYSNVDFASIVEYNNIMIMSRGETVKIDIVVQLLDEINNEIFHSQKAVKLLVNIDHFYFKNTELYDLGYALSYQSTLFGTYTYPKKEHQMEAAFLATQNENFDIQSCVKLIYYCWQHPTEIASNQSKIPAKKWHDREEQIISITPQLMTRIINMRFPELDTFFKRRYYAINNYVGQERLQFYYQDNKYHLFSLKNTQARFYSLSRQDREKSLIDSWDTTLMQLPDVPGIYGYDSVHLVFVSRDSFYYVDLNSKCIKGPFIYPYNFRSLRTSFRNSSSPFDDTFRFYYERYSHVIVKFQPKTEQFFLDVSFRDLDEVKRFIADTTTFVFKNHLPKTNAFAASTNPKLFLAGVCFVLILIITIIAQNKISIRL